VALRKERRSAASLPKKSKKEPEQLPVPVLSRQRGGIPQSARRHVWFVLPIGSGGVHFNSWMKVWMAGVSFLARRQMTPG
jgi:hypothetical protein